MHTQNLTIQSTALYVLQGGALDVTGTGYSNGQGYFTSYKHLSYLFAGLEQEEQLLLLRALSMEVVEDMAEQEESVSIYFICF